MQNLWTHFCGQSNCATNSSAPCNLKFVSITKPSSCVNHAFVACFNLLLLIVFGYSLIRERFSKKSNPHSRNRQLTVVKILSAAFTGCLGLVYLGFGIQVLVKKLKNDHSFTPIHWWILFFFNGVTWLLVGLTTSLRGEVLPIARLRLLNFLAFLYAGFVCFLALFTAIKNHKISVRVVLDILSFQGACLLLICAYKEYTPMNFGDKDIKENSSPARVTPFEKAGLFSKMSFSWLSPLMKLGRKKILEEDDLPKLRDMDRAGYCYLQFQEKLNTTNQATPPSESSILWAIIACHWTEILTSGFFALLKVVVLSAGPLFLTSFVRIAKGKESFRYEGVVLAVSLYLSKILESLSQRQWFFRSRLIGLNVRSMLMAALYRKQLRLSNAVKTIHSGGKIMNYTIGDAYRIGEFPYWFHQTWTTVLQIFLALAILVHSIGLATIASLAVIILTVICNTPLAKLQHKYQSKLTLSEDERLKACSEALVNMKVLKMYAWETHFKSVIEALRKVEYKSLSAVLLQKTYNTILFWTTPIMVSSATFGACYFLKVPLHASNVFTFVATLRLLQEPIRALPNVIGVVIQARVAFERIVKFLAEPELRIENIRKTSNMTSMVINHAIVMKSVNLSWETDPSKPTLKNLNLEVYPGEKLAICGEVGSGKSTLLAGVLGEVPYIDGTVEVYGRIAYVSQTSWIQSGTIRENILFGSAMDCVRYKKCLQMCSIVKDLELLPYRDMTVIGERGINLSGGQKQRMQLARALYQDADIYLLDDPFSAVDAHTATSLLNDYVMEALAEKTVLLVTHQVDFLPAFHRCLLMSDGEILHSGPYLELLASSPKFSDLVNAHKETAGTTLAEVSASKRQNYSTSEIQRTNVENENEALKGDQLIKKEEREVGNSGFKPYLLYLTQNKGYLYFSISALAHLVFVTGLIAQNTWMAKGVDNPHLRKSKLVLTYVIIGFFVILALIIRCLATVKLGIETSKSLFSQLLHSLFRAPVSFYDSTPLGRILSRLSSDLSIVDVDLPTSFQIAFGSTVMTYATLGVLAVITWQVLFVTVPVVYMAIRLQRYYFAAAKELMRLNGTTKSMVANHLAESLAGAMTIRAFQEEDRFFEKTLELIDTNASPFFLNFAANEWLIQRIETLSAAVLGATALSMVLLPRGTFSPGFVGMALSYGLSLNLSMIISIQNQCTLANQIICVERINQYMDIPSEAPEVIKDIRPPQNWPLVGKVEIDNLQIRYRPDTPLVLQGISCTFEGGDKIGIVGRTGSGKSTLIGALFRLVEPENGTIIVDGVDIYSIGLHDLRSRFGIIPQDPTLFNGTLRFNLDPLSQHNDDEIWEVLGKCQLKEVVNEKEQGLDSIVVEDGSNWSVGQRQLLCLGRALLRKSRVLILDEATASIDNATDMVLQKVIRAEFSDTTVITVAHRIPTIMDCTKVLAVSDGKVKEFDEPMKLMKIEGSLFGELVNEYWSHIHSADQSRSH